jgi:hypothetical protein
VPCRKFYGENALAEMKQRLSELYVSPKKMRKSKRIAGNDDGDDEDDLEVEDSEAGVEPKAKRKKMSR